MSIGAVSSSTSPTSTNYLTASTAPYQASPTNSDASTLPLTQVLGDGTDHTFTASTVDHELNVVTTPNPLGTASVSTVNNNAPDSLAKSGIGLNVSTVQ
jgi:hypothetical protein